MRIRFSLRLMLVIVAFVAITCAFCWPVLRQTMLANRLQGMGAEIRLEANIDDGSKKNLLDHLDSDIWEVRWRNGGGNTTPLDDDAFLSLCRLPSLGCIMLDDCNITDAGVAEIHKLPALTTLRLGNSKIGDTGVEYIVRNSSIETLSLSSSKVTDASCSKFKLLPLLYTLDLSGTAITDKSVAELGKMKQLLNLHINGTDITLKGAQKLREALPQCNINH